MLQELRARSTGTLNDNLYHVSCETPTALCEFWSGSQRRRDCDGLMMHTSGILKKRMWTAQIHVSPVRIVCCQDARVIRWTTCSGARSSYTYTAVRRDEMVSHRTKTRHRTCRGRLWSKPGHHWEVEWHLSSLPVHITCFTTNANSIALSTQVHWIERPWRVIRKLRAYHVATVHFICPVVSAITSIALFTLHSHSASTATYSPLSKCYHARLLPILHSGTVCRQAKLTWLLCAYRKSGLILLCNIITLAKQQY